ncbi:hypothetical protein [Mucilaginibacter sp.]|jgi:DNA-binding NarL/FixJ family response regulator|uniref:hypothetical protein n=1 Tax=Mucilaginibacter sp. TaxID=1882438 RepID=UPI00356976E7
MYKVLFIDEETEVFGDFKDYVDASPLKAEFEIITELPLNNIEEMIELIIKVNPDAIVTDFMLNDAKVDIKYNVPYNGSILVKTFTDIRHDFPCFILTSFDDQAITQSEDVNIVYIKNILHGDVETKTKARATFLERIKGQINHYKTRVDVAEKRLLELLEIRAAGKATIDQENEIIELDTFLESSIDRKSVIPKEFKSLSNTDRLDQILSKVDDILKKIDSEDGK